MPLRPRRAQKGAWLKNSPGEAGYRKGYSPHSCGFLKRPEYLRPGPGYLHHKQSCCFRASPRGGLLHHFTPLPQTLLPVFLYSHSVVAVCGKSWFLSVLLLFFFLQTFTHIRLSVYHQDSPLRAVTCFLSPRSAASSSLPLCLSF